jgi:3D (Asp-Asp-Asp) domain-containing protein
VLTAALALVVLPVSAGSRVPSPFEPVPAGAFQQIDVSATDAQSAASDAASDSSFLSEGALEAHTPIVEPPADAVAAQATRPKADQPNAGASSVRKGALSASLPGKPKYTLSGGATFYDNGTTAMRLPRGTVVKICGKGGCIVRVVNDYGPQKKTRVVDLYRPDFFAICGCPSWAGTTQVTVYVY